MKKPIEPVFTYEQLEEVFVMLTKVKHSEKSELPKKLQSIIIELAKKSQRSSKKEKIPPDLEDVRAYCKERKNGIDAEQFMDHYEARDWYAGKSKVKKWTACVRTWERDRNNKQQSTGNYNIKNMPSIKDKFPTEAFKSF